MDLSTFSSYHELAVGVEHLEPFLGLDRKILGVRHRRGCALGLVRPQAIRGGVGHKVRREDRRTAGKDDCLPPTRTVSMSN
jgi:hypothetical protein